MNSPAVVPGHLYVVATPIGNLGDLSPRAQAVLSGVDRICAEDTRTSGAMLAQFGIRKPLTALHEHNEDASAAGLVRLLKDGQALALISDAGTPLISDPGFALVRAARAAGVTVVAVPGPCAAVAALSVSGLPTDGFLFVGFLPPKAAARRAFLQKIASVPRTLVFYESSHRIAESVADLADLFPQRRLCLARELTKLYEESVTAGTVEIATWLAQDANRSRGEFVLVMEGATADAARPDEAEAERVLRVLLKELSVSQATRLAAELTGRRKNELYALATRLGADTGGEEG
ncbi:MAG: 16S rRNA (cytidine(1402)-2'-O)-methyltransferase [Nevskiaceae bacterium]|nr:MAG: 16S rRNA (cytidine(1402)-2'-O)-methyltransferase [Nevskiaceae bacterium]